MKLKEIRVDGYKNLINCRIPLGDFNVLVGPNNSGKTNMLEAFQILALSCLGGDDMRNAIFAGFPTRLVGSSICHLDGYKNKPLTIGVTLELVIEKKIWVVQYDVIIQRGDGKKSKVGFMTETLKAKEPSKTGLAKSYIKRQGDKVYILGKKRNIAKTNSIFNVIKELYPDRKGLTPELLMFMFAIIDTMRTLILAISPDGLRNAIDEEIEFTRGRVSSFDLLVTMEKIKEKKGKFRLFKETVCYILDLEDMEFSAQDIPIPSKERGRKDKLKRVRSCYVKREGSDFAPIEEFSDGTLAVASILAALFSEVRNGPILCLEELENCLHPAAVERLLRFMQENADRWPVLITTHSPYIVNGVKPSDVIVAVVDETGATHFEKITDRKALNNYFKSGYMNFGDLMATNFEEVLGGK